MGPPRQLLEPCHTLAPWLRLSAGAQMSCPLSKACMCPTRVYLGKAALGAAVQFIIVLWAWLRAGPTGGVRIPGMHIHIRHSTLQGPGSNPQRSLLGRSLGCFAALGMMLAVTWMTSGLVVGPALAVHLARLGLPCRSKQQTLWGLMQNGPNAKRLSTQPVLSTASLQPAIQPSLTLMTDMIHRMPAGSICIHALEVGLFRSIPGLVYQFQLPSQAPAYSKQGLLEQHGLRVSNRCLLPGSQQSRRWMPAYTATNVRPIDRVLQSCCRGLMEARCLPSADRQ